MSTDTSPPGNLEWRISSACEGGACVGVARHGDYVLIRNTGSLNGPVGKFTSGAWHSFLAEIKSGQLDVV
jgi:hypothetical protein